MFINKQQRQSRVYFQRRNFNSTHFLGGKAKSMKIIRLKPWEEFTGIFQDVKEEKGKIMLYFNQGNGIILPAGSQLRKRLKNMKGKKIAILRTDLENKPYLIRVVVEHFWEVFYMICKNLMKIRGLHRLWRWLGMSNNLIKKSRKSSYFFNSIFKCYTKYLIVGWVTKSIDIFSHPYIIIYQLNINNVIYKNCNFSRKSYIFSSSQDRLIQPAISTTENEGGTKKWFHQYFFWPVYR